jgi:small subunit ribosomal protein S26e
MPKKRRNRGRSKGKGSGHTSSVSCSNCGCSVPRDKAKKVSRVYYPVDMTLTKELRQSGSIIHGQRMTKNYCISCAIHYRIIKVGGNQDDRRY